MNSEYVYGQVIQISEKQVANGGTVYNFKLQYDDGAQDWFGAGFEALDFGKDSMIEFQGEYGEKFNNVVKGSIQVLEYVAPVQQGRGNSGGRQGNGGQRNGGNNSGQSGNSRGGSSSRGGNSQGGGRGQQPQSNGRSQQGRAPQQGRTPARQQAPARQSAPSQGAGQSQGLSKDQYWKNKELNDATKDIRIGSMACLNTAISVADSLLLNKAFTMPTKKDGKFDAYMALIFKIADQLEVRVQQKGDGTYGAMLPPTDAGQQGYENSTDAGQQYEDDIPQ